MSSASAVASPRASRYSLFRSTASVSAAIALGKAAGALKTGLITLYFRPGAGLDTYLLAFLLVSFLSDVFWGALNPVLVPALVEAGLASSEHGRLYATALRICAISSIALAALLGLGARLAQFLDWLPRPADPELFLNMLTVMLPILPLSAVSNVWRCVLNAEGRFSAASLSWVLTPLAVALSMSVAHAQGEIVLAVGSSLGLVAECVFLAAFLHRSHMALWPTRPAGQAARLPLTQYGAVVLGSLATKAAIAVDQAAAAFAGLGGLSVFNLGTRLALVLVAVGPGALGTAILPHFAKLISMGSKHAARSSLIRTLAIAMAATGLLASVMVWLSLPIARLAFSHGTLTGLDLSRVAQAQRWSLLQVPFSVGLAILYPFASALRANHSLLPIWFGALAAHGMLNFVVAAHYGVPGILCASGAIEATVLIAMLIVVFRKLQRHDPTQVVTVA